MNKSDKGIAVVTGASSGIGAIYADRLAKRGHDLILVARSRERLGALAKGITKESGRSVEPVVADLNDKGDLTRVEELLRANPNTALLVNNAGVGAPPALLDANIDKLSRMIDLNVTALVRLAPRAVV